MGRKNTSSFAAIVFALFGLTCSRAVADTCDALAVEITQATNATIERVPVNRLKLHHPYLDSAEVTACDSAQPKLSFDIETPYPQTTFFDFIGAVSPVVTKLDGDITRAAAVRCVKDALRDRDGLKDSYRGQMAMTCNAKGGKNGFVSVYVERSAQ